MAAMPSWVLSLGLVVLAVGYRRDAELELALARLERSTDSAGATWRDCRIEVPGSKISFQQPTTTCIRCRSLQFLVLDELMPSAFHAEPREGRHCACSTHFEGGGSTFRITVSRTEECKPVACWNIYRQLHDAGKESTATIGDINNWEDHCAPCPNGKTSCSSGIELDDAYLPSRKVIKQLEAAAASGDKVAAAELAVVKNSGLEMEDEEEGSEDGEDAAYAEYDDDAKLVETEEDLDELDELGGEEEEEVKQELEHEEELAHDTCLDLGLPAKCTEDDIVNVNSLRATCEELGLPATCSLADAASASVTTVTTTADAAAASVTTVTTTTAVASPSPASVSRGGKSLKITPTPPHCIALVAATTASAVLIKFGVPLVPAAALGMCCPKWVVRKMAGAKKWAGKKLKRMSMTKAQKLQDALSGQSQEEDQKKDENHVMQLTYDLGTLTQSEKFQLEDKHPWLAYPNLVEMYRFWPVDADGPGGCLDKLEAKLVEIRQDHPELPGVYAPPKGIKRELPYALRDSMDPSLVYSNKTVEDLSDSGWRGKLCYKLAKNVHKASWSLQKRFSEEMKLETDVADAYRQKYCFS